MLLELGKKRVLLSRQQNAEFAPCLRSHDLLYGKCAVYNEPDYGVWNRPNRLNATTRLVSCLYLDYIASTIFDNSVYTMQEGWVLLAHYAHRIKKLPAVLRFRSSLVSGTLGATRSSFPERLVNNVESVALEMFTKIIIVAEKLPAISHGSYMTIAVQLLKCENSSTIARVFKKRRLNTVFLPATAVMQEEDVLNVTKTAESSHMSPKAVVAQEALLQAMRTVFCAYTKIFQNLRWTNELQGVYDQSKHVELLLCNSPYNVHHRQSLPTGNHDVFTLNDMEAFVNFAVYVWERKGH